MAKRSYAHGTPEQMLAAFESKLQELGGDVSACSKVSAASYVDTDGAFGEPGATISEKEIRDYWEKEHLNDPSLSQYGEDGFEEWYRDTKQWLSPVKADAYKTVETNAEATSRYIHTLVGDVNAALEANSDLDSWTWEEQANDLVLTTIAGDSINEYSIPKSDLTLDWDRISEDVDYILSEVQSFEGDESGDIIDWLSEHEEAFEDALNYFNSDDLSDVSLDDIIGWISEHDTLYSDFVARFPSFGGDVSSAVDVNSSEIIEGIEYKHWDEIAEQYLHEMQAVNIDISDKPAVLNELMNNFGFTQEVAEGLFIRINECAADLAESGSVTSASLVDSTEGQQIFQLMEYTSSVESGMEGDDFYCYGEFFATNKQDAQRQLEEAKGQCPEFFEYDSLYVTEYNEQFATGQETYPNVAALIEDACNPSYESVTPEEYDLDSMRVGRNYSDPAESCAQVEGSVDTESDGQYELIRSKQVEDADGFMTDYTMYYDIENEQYVFVFGDNDRYKPEDRDFDYECESEDEAYEWFDSYNGFAEDEDSDAILESISIEADIDVDSEVDEIMSSNETHPYRMLSRFQSDFKYLLGSVLEANDGVLTRSAISHALWWKDISKQAEAMRKIYNRLVEKPEWISLDEIDEYERVSLSKVSPDEDLEDEFGEW